MKINNKTTTKMMAKEPSKMPLVKKTLILTKKPKPTLILTKKK